MRIMCPLLPGHLLPFVPRLSGAAWPTPPHQGRRGRETSPLRQFLLLLLGLLLASGCSKPNGTVLGHRPKGEPSTILAVRAGDTPREVTLTGVISEKCPIAGCWFRLRDETGEIKVDTKAAGFVVVNVPLNQAVTVAGRIVTEGDETLLEATGLRY